MTEKFNRGSNRIESFLYSRWWTGEEFSYFWGYVSALVGSLSLLFALVTLGWNPFESWRDTIGKFLIGIWTLLPPAYFWIEWVYYRDRLRSEDAKEDMKHTHDLARNIWLALIAILVIAFGFAPEAKGMGSELLNGLNE